MAKTKSEATNGIGSVSAPVSLFGDRFHGGKQQKEKAYLSFLEETSASKHKKAQTEFELSNTRNTVKELRLRIEESNARTRAHKQELRLLEKSERLKGERVMAREGADDSKYEELMQELESLKKELSKLKLDMAGAFEEKLKAEKKTEASEIRMAAYVNSIEEMRKEIENVNEEHVLVEIARLDAIRETRDIEAQREAEAAQFTKSMRQTRSQIKEMTREVNQTKRLEQKLAATNADLNVLQCEMELVREMVKNSKDNNMNEEEKRRAMDVESNELLQSAKAELEAAKKDLTSVKDEGFQLMSSMDAVREELRSICRETARLKRLEEKQELTIQNLNSKLLRAKSKMEATTSSEEKARAIVTNLSAALQQLQSEVDTAKKEKELIEKETVIIKANMEKTDSEISLAERRLEAAMQELEGARVSEAATLEKLKIHSERAVKERASLAQHSSVIRISRFEYEYLIGHAEGAQKIADKKVAATQAWVEALKASEKEMLMKIEVAQRDMRELEVLERNEFNRMGRSLTLEKALEAELSECKQQEREDIGTNLQPVAPTRKSLKENRVPAASRRSRTRRRSLAYGTGQFPQSPSITLRRRKVMPSLVRFLQVRQSAKHK